MSNLLKRIPFFKNLVWEGGMELKKESGIKKNILETFKVSNTGAKVILEKALKF